MLISDCPSEIILPYQRAAFSPVGLLPDVFGSIFIRRGDKSLEGLAMRNVSEFFSVARTLKQKYNISHIYLASDSADVIEESIVKFGAEFSISYLPVQRQKQGWVDDLEWRAANEAAMSRLGAITLVDTFLSAQALYHIGTYGSNQCRLIDELRKASGNTCFPCFWVDNFT